MSENTTSQVVKNKEILRITNRHIAKILFALEQINAAEVIKTSVKNEFWLFAKDMENIVDNSVDNVEDNSGMNSLKNILSPR